MRSLMPIFSNVLRSWSVLPAVSIVAPPSRRPCRRDAGATLFPRLKAYGYFIRRNRDRRRPQRLVNAAYLARAGKKVLVLERRHILGGAACTEEIFPGFKFSVCSYVVSLLRPEIIRDLDLPRHGLEILPLDGSSRHAQRRLPVARERPRQNSPRDRPPLPRRRRSLRRIRQAMQAMCRFVKPILSMVPPTQHAQPARTDEAPLHRTPLPGHVEQ